jgi:hypothetical protein
MTKYIIAILVLFSLSLNAADTTLVRLKVDIDSIQLSINDQLYTTDLYGNLLLKDAWFIISLDSGDYNISLNLDDSLLADTLLNIVDQEIITLEYIFLIPRDIDDTITSPEIIDETVKITINSDPDSAFVIINNDSINQTTPLNITLPPDTVRIEVYKNEYEKLVSTMMLDLNRDVNANFILRTLSPPGITPESLGLSYMPIQEMRDTLSLKRLSGKYKSMSEVFFIFPLLQGLFMKLVVSDDIQNDANLMVLSGAGLTIGTYLLGKIVVNTKRKNILSGNEQRELDNITAFEHNGEVDSIIVTKNQELIKKWERENINRGKVDIIDNKDTTSAD